MTPEAKKRIQAERTVEKFILYKQALEKCAGSKTKAAKMLNVHRNTIVKVFNKYASISSNQ